MVGMKCLRCDLTFSDSERFCPRCSSMLVKEEITIETLSLSDYCE